MAGRLQMRRALHSTRQHDDSLFWWLHRARSGPRASAASPQQSMTQWLASCAETTPILLVSKLRKVLQHPHQDGQVREEAMWGTMHAVEWCAGAMMRLDLCVLAAQMSCIGCVWHARVPIDRVAAACLKELFMVSLRRLPAIKDLVATLLHDAFQLGRCT